MLRLTLLLQEGRQTTILQARKCIRAKWIRFGSQTSSTMLSKQEIRSFQEDGAVCLRGKFTAEWLEKVKQGIHKVYENPSEYGEKLTRDDANSSMVMVYFNDYINWRRISEISDFVFYSPASEIARQLMSSEKVAFYHEHVFVKHPGTCYPTPWHHDQAYYPIDGRQNCSLWMPIDKVSKKNSIKFIKGSHHWGKWFIPKKFETLDNYNTNEGDSQHEYSEMIDIDGQPSKYEALAWDLEPGDCIAFHMLTVHGAQESTDEHGRQVLASRWLGDDAVLAKRPWTVSPPIVPEGFKVGDSIFSYPDIFPVVGE